MRIGKKIQERADTIKIERLGNRNTKYGKKTSIRDKRRGIDRMRKNTLKFNDCLLII
jgi:hypothetical protein